MCNIKFIKLLFLFIPFISISQEYPIKILEEGHILVQVKLSNDITGNFILDTGAGVNVLSTKIFNKIASNATKKGYFTGFRHDGDRLDGEIYEIPYLSIGEVKQMKPVVGVYPPLDAMGIDGLISLKFFEDKPFSIDYKNQKIIFEDNNTSKKLSKKSLTLSIETYKYTNILLDIFIPITLNDSITLLAEFDTGSGYDVYILNPGYIMDLKLKSSKLISQKYKTQLSGQERTDSLYKLKTITLEDTKNKIEKKDVTIIFREGMIHNALIGSGLFRDKKITIDIPNKKFIVHNNF